MGSSAALLMLAGAPSAIDSNGSASSRRRHAISLGSISSSQRSRPRRRFARSEAVEQASLEVAADTQPRSSTKTKTVIILPGLGNNTGDYAVFCKLLEATTEVKTKTLPVTRPDWLRNASGAVTADYWRGTLKPRPVLDWYLKRVAEAVEAAVQESGEKVTLLGHSAGGWLARVYMKELEGFSNVDALVTLGTPHRPPPKDVPGVVDQTRGLLFHIEDNYPGAHHDDVRYVCVAGKYEKGAKLTRGEGKETVAEEQTASLRQKIIGQGYKLVCGSADVWGDGVVPVESAHLPGAINITLEGVYHSPVGATDVPEVGKAGRPWYGSTSILPQWIEHL